MKPKAKANRETQKQGSRKSTAGLPRARVAPAVATRPELPAIDPKWRWHFRTLVSLRDGLVRHSEEKRRESAEPIEAHGMHVADSATDEFEHDVALAFLAREENALREIADAIARIVDGRYGVCEATGATIPSSRLRAVPWCRYSRAAEEKIERRNGDAKFRVPAAVSLRGTKGNLPGTGTVTREDSEGPRDEARPTRKPRKLEETPAPDAEENER